MKISLIQNLAIFFGWNYEKAKKIKITSEEIAPNGTRRGRRINNNFIPEGDNSIYYLIKINEELKKVEGNAMTKKEAKKIIVGDIVISKKTGESYLVLECIQEENNCFTFRCKSFNGSDDEAFYFKHTEVYLCEKEIKDQNTEEHLEPASEPSSKPEPNVESADLAKATSNPFTKSKMAAKAKCSFVSEETCNHFVNEASYNEMKFSRKSNLTASGAYIIPIEGGFFASIINCKYGVIFKSCNLNTAKKIFNAICLESK